MSNSLESILSGSCTPATDLLVEVEYHGLDYSSALAAYNSRLFPRDRVVSLHDAANRERDFQISRDI